MDSYYDPSLKDRISSNNGGSNIALNCNFGDWEDHLRENLRREDFLIAKGDRYEEGECRELKELCVEHEREYNSPLHGARTMILVHPFYLPLSHMHYVKTRQTLCDSREYLEALMGFLYKRRSSREAMNVVALDTVHHYAAATSLLIERGLIDCTIFTLYDTGEPLDHRELDVFRGHTLFFGGGYNGGCLETSIRSVNRAVNDSSRERFSARNLRAVSDLVLNSPREHRFTLKPWHIKGLWPSQAIELEEFERVLRKR